VIPEHDPNARVTGLVGHASRAHDFWYSYGGVSTDVITGSASLALEVLGMISESAAIAASGAVVTVVGAVAVPVAVLMGFAEVQDNSVKTFRLYAMAFQATDWVMEPRYFVSRGAIPRPDQPVAG
jgi:hypothetical protein